MSKQTKWKIFWITLVIASLFVGAIMGSWYFFMRYKPRMYITELIPSSHAGYVLEWSRHYDLKWIDVISIMAIESEFKRTAKSHKNCYGYMQISGSTADTCRQRLNEHIKSTHVYDAEFNIAAGCLTFRSCLELARGDMEKALLYYNVGYGDYRRGVRNYRYVKKFYQNKLYFQYRYKKYRWGGK